MQHPHDAISFIKKFPDQLQYKALWAPIYWEPIFLSGERITALITAIGLDDGKISVTKCIRDDVIKALYPENKAEAISLISWIAKSLEYHLREGGDLANWDPPITGFSAGVLNEIYSTSFDKVPYQVIPLCSSLGQAYVIESPKVLSANEMSMDRVRALIRDDIIRKLPRLKHSFNKPFNLVDGARRSTIDFVGNNVAANFSKLSYKNLGRSVKDSKAQILDLVTYKQRPDLYANEEQYKLVILRPLAISPDTTERHIKIIDEAYLEIENEALHFELDVAAYADPKLAAQEIVRAEIRLRGPWVEPSTA